jgi:MFS superfamily sulfate permease-like transporter
MPLPHSWPRWLTTLPGAADRRRALVVVAAALTAFLLRPVWPFLQLPGWVVGGLLLWAVVELLRWAWWPRRWR